MNGRPRDQRRLARYSRGVTSPLPPRAAALAARLSQRLIDSGRVPEPVLRGAIRAVCRLRLAQERRRPAAERAAWIAGLADGELAIAADAANAQHYEVPAAFFERVLGPHLKYSSAYWPPGVERLADAEAAMLALTAERAGLADGQRVLDLGCGWGALSLWAAARYPTSQITALSGSRSQRAFIEARAAARGLTNLTVRTADLRDATFPAAAFDRIVSVEMLEHVRNHAAALRKIAGWLAPDGALFVHVFAHRAYAYPYEDAGATDWMAREFFTGGIMPSVDLLPQLAGALAVDDAWQLPGTHYARTAEAWHANLRADRAALAELLGGRAAVERWRLFFLACAELFGYADGREWLVAHYRFRHRPRA